MGICSPEILRTEKFGSREVFDIEKGRCSFCGAELLEEGSIWDIVGNLFCSNVCREKNFERRKEKIEND